MIWDFDAGEKIAVASGGSLDDFTATAKIYGKPVLFDGKGQNFISDGWIFRFLPTQ